MLGRATLEQKHHQGHPAREIASPKAPISAKFTVGALSFEHLHPFIRRFFARIDPKSLIKSVKLFPSWMALPLRLREVTRTPRRVST